MCVCVLFNFTTLVIPLAAASQAPTGRAAAASLVWWMGFALGTVEVHAIKARAKGTARSQWTRLGSPLLSMAATIACLVSVFFGEDSYRWPALALLPSAVAVLFLAFLRVHPRKLKKVGWTLVAANTVTLVLLLAS